MVRTTTDDATATESLEYDRVSYDLVDDGVEDGTPVSIEYVSPHSGTVVEVDGVATEVRAACVTVELEDGRVWGVFGGSIRTTENSRRASGTVDAKNGQTVGYVESLTFTVERDVATDVDVDFTQTPDEEERRRAEATGDTRDLLTPTDAEVAEAFGVDDVDDITDEMLEDVDTPEPPERVDVSGYKTASGAAKKTHDALQDWAEFLGHDEDEVVLYRPEDDYQGSGTWAVVWEGGPYEWAAALTGGTTLTGFAGPRMNYDGTPEVAGLTSGEGFGVECHYSFDILFYDR